MLMRTQKTVLDTDEIQALIEKYQEDTVPELDDMWEYYKGMNPAVLARKAPDQNTPTNNTPVPYGRKIVTTFTGYAYRPRYITYKSENEAYMNELQVTFNLNNEHIKTNRDGRNTAIFGRSYDLVYIEGREGDALTRKAEPMFINCDPREVILLYDFSPSPKKAIGIRFYPMDKLTGKVDVYYPDRIISYIRRSKGDYETKWVYSVDSEFANFFEEVPIVPYYMGDEMLGVIRPVKGLIDDYDVLLSDSVVEFDRFANAYLRLVKMSATSPVNEKRPGDKLNRWLRDLRKSRVFQNLNSPDDVTFLTKDIPKEFVEFMTGLISMEIHKQSHVPDLTNATFGGDLSGVAIQRLMFDFENMVSSAEGDFDLGLTNRIELITRIYDKTGRGGGGSAGDITISHKRNIAINLKEFAEISKLMKEAGFSDYATVDVWPDDIMPDVEEELQRRRDEFEASMPSIDMIPPPDEDEDAGFGNTERA